jgi:hypothetical protein
VVVAVGLTFVEPLANAEVNVPGVIAILVTSVAVQLRVLLAPELIPVGLAAKELIAGIDCGPFPVDDVDAPQAARPTQVRRTTARVVCFGAGVSRSRIEELRQHLSFDDFISSYHSIADASTTVALYGRSPLGHIPQVQGGHRGCNSSLYECRHSVGKGLIGFINRRRRNDGMLLAIFLRRRVRL